MGAFIKLNKQDAYITPYTAFKSYTIASSSFGSNGINIYYGERTPDFTTLYPQEPTGEEAYINGYHKHLVYKSINQLYYSNYSGSVASGSFINFEQTTQHDVTRSLGDQVSILSIPRTLYGSSIRPGTFILNYSSSEAIVDDTDGKLFDYSSSVYVGDIIYPHGMAIITNQNYLDILYGETVSGIGSGSYTSVSFDNQYDIFTHYYHCKVSQNQLNFSQNPTAYTNTPVSGTLHDNVTGSYFQPYVTTVGLYNDNNELIAVGKLAQPTPKSQFTDTTFVVRIDM